MNESRAMVAHCWSVAFEGLEPRLVDVQCQLVPGTPGFALVGLPDKAVAEAKERVRAALAALGLALPAQRVVINLAPADLPKEGAHFDLPIALALMAALGALPPEEPGRALAMGELALDGRIVPTGGALLGAMAAGAADRAFICAAESGGEAALAGPVEVLAAASLIAVANHFAGRRALVPPTPSLPNEAPEADAVDLAEVKGQEKARRALEIAAAGGHNLLLIGPPGVGKSMLARALPGILPPLSPAEALEVAMIRSVAGKRIGRGLSRRRPFQKPHQGASVAAVIGGGRDARPGQLCLAHRGVLFLDEIAEFARPVLEGLRQPMETGDVVISRARAHARYPARAQIVGAMNPCRCGHLADPARACSRAPKCGEDYAARLSGPLLDRIDLRVETPPLPPGATVRLPRGEPSAAVAARVAAARGRQTARWGEAGLNAHADGAALEDACAMDAGARDLLALAAERLGLSPRGITRTMRLARTIADLAGSEGVIRPQMAEALGFRPPLLRG